MTSVSQAKTAYVTRCICAVPLKFNYDFYFSLILKCFTLNTLPDSACYALVYASLQDFFVLALGCGLTTFPTVG